MGATKRAAEIVCRYRQYCIDFLRRTGVMYGAEGIVKRMLERLVMNAEQYDSTKGHSFRLWLFCTLRSERKRTAA